MKVLVEFVGKLAKEVNVSKYWTFLDEEATLGDFLNALERDKGIKINPRKMNVTILVNGHSANFPEDLNIKLKELDKIVIMYPVAGG